MTIVCEMDQTMRSFVRTYAQSSRSLNACMDAPISSLIIDIDNQTEGFDDFDDMTITSFTSKAKESKKWANRAKADEEPYEMLSLNWEEL